MTNATMREGSVYHDAYDGMEDIEEQYQAMAKQIGPKLIYETAEQRQTVNAATEQQEIIQESYASLGQTPNTTTAISTN